MMTDRTRPPRQIGDHQIGAVVNGLLEDATAACARWLTIQQRATDWARHYPSQGDGIHGGGIIDNMAERLATELSAGRQVVDPGAIAIRWLWEMKEIGERLKVLREQASYMVPKQPELKREETIGKCECCQRDVARTTADTLKAGLCNKCHASWTAAKRRNKDRHTWLNQRILLLATRGLHALDDEAATG